MSATLTPVQRIRNESEQAAAEKSLLDLSHHLALRDEFGQRVHGDYGRLMIFNRMMDQITRLIDRDENSI